MIARKTNQKIKIKIETDMGIYYYIIETFCLATLEHTHACMKI